MMSIDDMLSQVAQIVGTVPENKPDTKPHAPAFRSESVHNELKTASGAALHYEPVSENIISMKPALSLQTAKEIIYCIRRGAEIMDVNAVIAVVDGGGKLIALEAMDDSYIASVRAAQEKAFTAVALKMPTHTALKESRGGLLDGYTNGNGIMMLGGGWPVAFNGSIVGGIGVSGGTKDQDIALAKTGAVYFEKRTESLK